MCAPRITALALAALAMAGLQAEAGLFSRHHESPLAPAVALYEKAEYSGAAAQFKALTSKNLSSDDKQLAYWYLANSYRKAGKPDMALPVLQLAVQLYPDNLELLLSLAELYYETDLYSQAKTQFESILEANHEDASQLGRLHAGLARTYEALGYLGQAADHYREAMGASNPAPGIGKEYARCLIKQRKYGDAGAALSKELAKTPQDPELLFLSAKINYDTGQKEAAVAELVSALEKARERDDMRLTLALWLISSGSYLQAAIHAQEVYSRHPDSAQAQWALGLALLNTPGKRERALELLKKAAASVSSPFTAQTAQLLLDKANSKQR